MIKINLLPHRVEKIKKGLGREELIYIGIGALTLLIVSVSFALIFFFDSAKKKETQTLKKEQARLTLVTKEIQELQKVQKEADERLAVIKKLNQGRKDIVKVLDELNGALPPKVWLTSLKQDKDRFSIEGYASDSNFISTFMKNMEATGKFSKVDLSGVTQEDISKIKVQKFSISTSWKMPVAPIVASAGAPTKPPAKPAPQPPQQGKK